MEDHIIDLKEDLLPDNIQRIMYTKFLKLDESSVLPEFKTSGSAGADVCSLEHKKFLPNGRCVVKTGLACEIPEGYVLMVCSRSGLAKQGLIVGNQPGIIDSDYRGEIGVLLWNTSDSTIEIKPGDRIAQLLLIPAPCWIVNPVEDLSCTERGQGGFGSTGIS